MRVVCPPLRETIHKALISLLFEFLNRHSLRKTDFNQAEALRRDDTTGDNCLFHSQHYYGSLRAPEMYREKHLANEKADIWGLGIAFYSLLTGMANFHDECDSKKNISKRVLKGEIPWIDERWKTKSVAEARLVDVIIQCFVYDPKDRIDINRVIQLLKDAQDEVEKAQ
jgi:serine/threonine protein kinase